MRRVPYSVSVVLDQRFGLRLRELLAKGPVWAVDSPVNREVAQMLWREFPGRDHLEGITISRTGMESTPVQMLIEEMDTIDEHHGVYSADPAYTVIRVIGCELDSEVQENLAKFGFDSFSRTAEGFEARRPPPPQLGA